MWEVMAVVSVKIGKLFSTACSPECPEPSNLGVQVAPRQPHLKPATARSLLTQTAETQGLHLLGSTSADQNPSNFSDFRTMYIPF